MKRILLPLALAGGLGACAPSLDAPPPSTCAIGAPYLTMQLYFGRSVAGRVPVSDAAWQAFVDGVVTPNFPDGFTVLDAQGHWRNPQTGEIVREPTKLVIIGAPRAAPLRARIDTVTSTYKQRFAQQSVGVVIADACAAF
jgi:hypothetical protein